MKRKTKKEKKNEPARKEDRGCKGELAQFQQVPERSEWSSTKEIVSLEAELKQAKREITDLVEKSLHSFYNGWRFFEDGSWARN